MTDKPTGVFVRLPMSDEQRDMMVDAAAFHKPDDSHDKALLEIGTPVTGGELDVVAYINPREKSSPNVAFRPFHDYQPLVLQSDALALLAARDAEIARLREALRLLLADWEDCMGGERPSIGSNAAREALKGGAA